MPSPERVASYGRGGAGMFTLLSLSSDVLAVKEYRNCMSGTAASPQCD